jgi:6-phosphogluconolactonase
VGGSGPSAGTGNSFAYVMGWQGISAFKIDATTGTLNLVSTLDSPNSMRMAVHPNGKFAYVMHSLSENPALQDVAAYRINAADGSLTHIGTPVPLESLEAQWLCCITVHPSGQFLYAGVAIGGTFPDRVEHYVLTYAINATTGALSFVGRSLLGMFNLAYTNSAVSSINIEPSGRFAYLRIAGSKPGTSGIDTYTINPTDGSFTLVVTPDQWPDKEVDSMTIHPGGKFAYVGFLYHRYILNTPDPHAIQAYSIEDTGALTEVGSAAPAGPSSSMVFEPSGRMLYSGNLYYGDQSSIEVWGYITDPDTGWLLRPLGSAVPAGPQAIRSMSLDPSGKFAYLLNETSESVYEYSINPVTGALTSMGAPVRTAPIPMSITTVKTSN